MQKKFIAIASSCLGMAAVLSSQGATPPAAPTGTISAKGFINIGAGTAVTDLTSNPKFPASPDVAYYYPYFEWNADPGGDINTPANNAYGDSYGVQMAGVLLPARGG